jgi:hypothetical protein
MFFLCMRMKFFVVFTLCIGLEFRDFGSKYAAIELSLSLFIANNLTPLFENEIFQKIFAVDNNADFACRSQPLVANLGVQFSGSSRVVEDGCTGR